MWVMFSTNVLLDGLTAWGWGWCQSLEGTFGNPHPNCSPPWAELSQDFHRTQPESLVQDSGLQELILGNLSSPLSHLTCTTSNCTESAAHTGQFLALDHCIFFAHCLRCPPTLIFLSWRTTQAWGPTQISPPLGSLP